jgi:hypothetical protein
MWIVGAFSAPAGGFQLGFYQHRIAISVTFMRLSYEKHFKNKNI